MNSAWLKVFGTPDQPNKPARATIQAANLVAPGALVEIEFVAAKKVKSAAAPSKARHLILCRKGPSLWRALFSQFAMIRECATREPTMAQMPGRNHFGGRNRPRALSGRGARRQVRLFWRTNRWRRAVWASGPNPYDLLNAALGACKTMTIRLYANRKAWPLKHVEVAVRHRRTDLNARDVFEVDVTLEGDLDESQRARLMEIAERCPVQHDADARLRCAHRA